jgi:hypothetical protein
MLDAAEFKFLKRAVKHQSFANDNVIKMNIILKALSLAKN